MVTSLVLFIGVGADSINSRGDDKASRCCPRLQSLRVLYGASSPVTLSYTSRLGLRYLERSARHPLFLVAPSTYVPQRVAT